MTVARLIPKPHFPRPYVLLSSPGHLKTGERFFILDYFPTASDGGGSVGVWDGTSYSAAILAAEDFDNDGIPCHDVVGYER